MIAMISRVLGSVTPWLLAVLIGIATYAGMQARYYASESAESQARAARSEERAEILIEHQRWQRKQLQTMTLVLTARDEQLQRDGELIDLVRQAARNLERDDAETADWAGQPSPAVVSEWLRDLTADNSASGSDAGDTGAPAAAAATATP